MINRDNCVAVMGFLRYQEEVLQHDPRTVDRNRLWLKHLLRWADAEAFINAPNIRHIYPRHLLTVRHGSQDKALGPTGVRRACQMARAFFKWLEIRRRKYTNLTLEWIATIQPPRMAVEPPTERQIVTLDTVRELLRVPDDGSLVIRRDKVAAAFLYFYGARSSAFCSLSLDCVDITNRTVYQYPTRWVRTKNNKAAVTRLLEIQDLLEEVLEWDDHIRAGLPSSAVWYTVLSEFDGRLTDAKPGLYRHKKMRKSLCGLFMRAGLSPMSPHKFRHGHAVYGLKQAKDIGDFKAVSMNLMHSSLGITDSIYAVFSDNDVKERIARLGQIDKSRSTDKD